MAVSQSTTPADLLERYRVAVQIADQASELVRGYFQQGLDFDKKSDASPVTAADREAEQLLRQQIELTFPDDGIIGEELSDKVGSSPYRWILDPIDGTKSFISDVPLFGTMVAVERDGRGVIGVIAFPALNVSIDAVLGGGAWENTSDGSRKPARV